MTHSDTYTHPCRAFIINLMLQPIVSVARHVSARKNAEVVVRERPLGTLANAAVGGDKPVTRVFIL